MNVWRRVVKHKIFKHQNQFHIFMCRLVLIQKATKMYKGLQNRAQRLRDTLNYFFYGRQCPVL